MFIGTMFVAVLFILAAVWFAPNLLQKGPKLAPVPRRVPMGQSWHVVRDGKADSVCKILGGGGRASGGGIDGAERNVPGYKLLHVFCPRFLMSAQTNDW